MSFADIIMEGGRVNGDVRGPFPLATRLRRSFLNRSWPRKSTPFPELQFYNSNLTTSTFNFDIPQLHIVR